MAPSTDTLASTCSHSLDKAVFEINKMTSPPSPTPANELKTWGDLSALRDEPRRTTTTGVFQSHLSDRIHSTAVSLALPWQLRKPRDDDSRAPGYVTGATELGVQRGRGGAATAHNQPHSDEGKRILDCHFCFIYGVWW